MVERREQVGFPREARQPLGIAREELGENLERDVSRQFAVARTIHLAHAAGADQRDDLEGAEAGAWRKGHDA